MMGVSAEEAANQVPFLAEIRHFLSNFNWYITCYLEMVGATVAPAEDCLMTGRFHGLGGFVPPGS